jgi:proteic killer suppression protein
LSRFCRATYFIAGDPAAYSPDTRLDDTNAAVTMKLMPVFQEQRDRKGLESRAFQEASREIQERALMKLQQLHAAGDLQDLMIPVSNQLEALKGDRRGEYSIRVNKQWRICFEWRNSHAWDVELADYH